MDGLVRADEAVQPVVQPPDDLGERVEINAENSIDESKADVKTDRVGGPNQSVIITDEGKPNVSSCLKQDDASNFDTSKEDLTTEMDVLATKTNVTLTGGNNICNADIKTEAGGESNAVPAEEKPNILSFTGKSSGENNIDEADVKTGDMGGVAEDNPAEASGSKIKKRRYKKRKKPPPFIGPRRPIQEEDLVDIMNGVYDIVFNITDPDEELVPLSSSNESCNSSDSEGWLVESSSESDSSVEGYKNSAFVEQIELIKIKLQDAIACKEKLLQTTNFVSADESLTCLDELLRATITSAEPKLQAGLDALTALSKTPITKLSLVKHTHLIVTASKLCKYKLPHRLLLNSRETMFGDALTLTSEAVKMLKAIVTLFGTKSEQEFWEVIIEMVEDFEGKTKYFTLDEKYLLTEFPQTCELNPAGHTINARMAIDDPRDEDRFADDESQAETVSQNVLKETGNILKKPQVLKRRQSRSKGKENRSPPSKVCRPRRKNQTRAASMIEEIHAPGGSASSVNADKDTGFFNVISNETSHFDKPVNSLELQNNLDALPSNDTLPIGSLTSNEFANCEDLLVDSDDSAPFSAEDDIPLSLISTAHRKSIEVASGFQSSLQTDSGISSGTSFLREVQSSQRISQLSQLQISDEQLLQSSDSDN